MKKQNSNVDITKNKALDIAMALRLWFNKQNRYSSSKEMARDLGINFNTLRHYFKGNNIPQGDNLERLRRAVKIPELESLPKGNKSAVPKANSIHQAQRVAQAMNQLSQALEFFREGTKEDRLSLKATIPPEDIGYLTTLLRALYEEDTFQQWVLFTSYKIKSGGKQ